MGTRRSLREIGDGVAARVATTVAVLCCVVILMMLAVPLGVVVVMSFWSSVVVGAGHFTTVNFEKVLQDRDSIRLLANTVVYSSGASLIAVGLGAAFAWALATVQLPAKGLIRLMPLAVLILPPLMKETAWIELYSPNIGLVNLVLMQVLNTDQPPFNIFSMLGMIVTVGFNMAPIPYIVLLAPFQALDASFGEASRMSGGKTARTVREVTIPILLPAFMSALTLTLVIVASSFESPIVLGLPGGVLTYTAVIYRSLSGGVPNFNVASAQACVFLLLTGLLVAWHIVATRRERRFVSITGRGASRPATKSRLVGAIVVAAFLAYFVLALVLPVLVTALVSLLPYYTVTEGNLLGRLSTLHYNAVLNNPRITQALGTSMTVSVATVVGVIVAAFGLAFVALKSKIPGRRLAEVLGTLPVGVPAMVFSVALLVTVISIPIFSLAYNTYVPMIAAEIIVFLPFAVRLISSALIQVDDSLSEAAVMSGAARWTVIRTIVFPLVRPAITNAALGVFILAFRELGAVVLLVAVNTVLFPAVVFEFWERAELGPVAALNIISLVWVVVVLITAFAIGALSARARPSWRPTVQTDVYALMGWRDREST